MNIKAWGLEYCCSGNATFSFFFFSSFFETRSPTGLETAMLVKTVGQ